MKPYIHVREVFEVVMDFSDRTIQEVVLLRCRRRDEADALVRAAKEAYDAGQKDGYEAGAKRANRETFK